MKIIVNDYFFYPENIVAQCQPNKRTAIKSAFKDETIIKKKQ